MNSPNTEITTKTESSVISNKIEKQIKELLENLKQIIGLELYIPQTEGYGNMIKDLRLTSKRQEHML